LTQGSEASEPVLQEYLKFIVYDHNKVLKNEIIGCCFFRLKLIKDQHFNGRSSIEAHLITFEEMELATKSGYAHSNDYWDEMGFNLDTTKDLGKLSLNSTIKKINRQSEMPTAKDDKFQN